MAASELTPAERSGVRTRLGVPDHLPVVLFASKFMRRKHPESVLHAAKLLQQRGIEATVLMVGAGEMDSELRALASGLGLQNVVFTGFVNQSELPRVYAAADVFVLPSAGEPWGFIINEVMCAGLPVVVSDDVGSVPDLVRDGVNGRLMKAGDARSMADALADMLADPALLTRMGEASRATIGEWNYERCRKGLVAAARATREEQQERARVA